MASQKKLILLVVAVVALFSLYSLLEHRDRTQEIQQQKASQLLSLPMEHISQISYLWISRPESQEEWQLTRENGQWQILTPKPLPANKKSISEFLEGLREFQLPEPIETESATDRYGLEEVNHWIRLTTQKGDQVTIKLGDESPIGGKRYLQIQGKRDIYLVDMTPFEMIEKGGDAFVDHRVVSLDPFKIQSIEKKRNDALEWKAEKREGAWYLTQPRALRADEQKLEELTSLLSELKWNQVVLKDSDADSLKKETKDAYLYTVTFSDPNMQPVEIELWQGNASDRWGVTVSSSPFVYTVMTDVAHHALITSGYTDVHHHHGFDFFPWQVERVEWTIAGQQEKRVKEGSEWYEYSTDGASKKRIDSQSMISWVETLIRLKIAAIEPISAGQWTLRRSAYGLDKPDGVATLVWKLDSTKNPQEKTLHIQFKTLADRHYMVVDGENDPDEVWQVSENVKELFLQKMSSEATKE